MLYCVLPSQCLLTFRIVTDVTSVVIVSQNMFKSTSTICWTVPSIDSLKPSITAFTASVLRMHLSWVCSVCADWENVIILRKMPSMYDADNYLYILCDTLQCNIINLISVFLFVCYFYSLGASCCQNLRLLCRVTANRRQTEDVTLWPLSSVYVVSAHPYYGLHSCQFSACYALVFWT